MPIMVKLGKKTTTTKRVSNPKGFKAAQEKSKIKNYLKVLKKFTAETCVCGVSPFFLF